MADVEELTKAISAHAAWKARLSKAIESGASDLDPAQVGANDQCEFGKWLGGLPSGDKSQDHWNKVFELHSRFHKEAATVLQYAISGQKAEAEKSLALGGSYYRASANLTQAMMEWKSSLKK